jgi:hypothetical protein
MYGLWLIAVITAIVGTLVVGIIIAFYKKNRFWAFVGIIALIIILILVLVYIFGLSHIASGWK